MLRFQLQDPIEQPGDLHPVRAGRLAIEMEHGLHLDCQRTGVVGSRADSLELRLGRQADRRAASTSSQHAAQRIHRADKKGQPTFRGQVLGREEQRHQVGGTIVAAEQLCNVGIAEKQLPPLARRS
jgi:hypothetical protein